MRRTVGWAMGIVGLAFVCYTILAMWHAGTRGEWALALLGYLASLALTFAGLRVALAGPRLHGIPRRERKRLEAIWRESLGRASRDAHVPIRPLVAKPPSAPDVGHNAQPPR